MFLYATQYTNYKIRVNFLFQVDTLKKAALQFMVKKGKDMMSLRGIESLGANQMRTLLTFTLENPELVPKKRLTTGQLRRQLTQMERELTERVDGNEGQDQLLNQLNLFMPDDLI